MYTKYFFFFTILAFPTYLLPMHRIERNIKPIATASSIAAGIAAMKFAQSNLVDKALGYKELEDSDPCKKMCIDELAAIGLPNARATKVKKCELDFFEEGVAQARGKELILAKSVCESCTKPDFDKDAFRFLLRHEGSHIKNNDYTKDFAFKIGSFNALFYGIHCLMQGVNPQHLPANKSLSSLVKIISPIVIAYKVSSLVTNLYRSWYEDRADREAAADLALAKGGLRFFEQTEKSRQSTPQYSHPFLARLLDGRCPHSDREKALRSYVKKFERNQI